MDWVKGVANIKLTFGVELRPLVCGAVNGFLLPADQIIATARETFAAFKTVAREAARYFVYYR